MPEDANAFDRRSVLTTIGATALAGVGVGAASGGAAARTVEADLERAYADERRLQAALDRHAGGVVATLREAGIVGESFDLADLDFEIDDEVGGLAPTTADGRAGVTAVVRDGTATAVGMVSASSDSHEISLYVQPERDDAYAFVEPKDGGDRLVVTRESVEPQGCSYTSCESCCSDSHRSKVTWNCDPYCANCHVYSTACGCYDAACAYN